MGLRRSGRPLAPVLPPSGPTRVGVNLLWLVPGVVGGSEDYFVASLLALARAAPADLEVTVFGLDALREAHPDLAAAFPFVPLRVRGARRPVRVAAESSWLAAQVSRRRLDVVHHGGGVVPFAHPGHTVLTVHDLQPLEFPERFGLLKRTYLARMLPRSVRAADVIVTTSQWVQDSVVSRLAAPPQRCHVVPPCVAPGATRPGPAEIAAVRARYGIDRPYVMYPAITYPHKNHRVLIEALARLTEGPAAELELVLTGGRGDAEAALGRQIAALGLAARARRVGRVPRADLDALLAGAVALVYPSSYEGFGLPVLDAMTAGVPVAVAYSTALGEVVGDGGILVPTHDVEAWARALADLVTRADLRATLSAAGAAQAATFTEARTAAALADAYRAAARGGLTAAPPGGPTRAASSGPSGAAGNGS